MDNKSFCLTLLVIHRIEGDHLLTKPKGLSGCLMSDVRSSPNTPNIPLQTEGLYQMSRGVSQDVMQSLLELRPKITFQHNLLTYPFLHTVPNIALLINRRFVSQAPLTKTKLSCEARTLLC